MKSTIARIPTAGEFEDIVLKMGLQILAMREEAGDRTYTLKVGQTIVEVPTRAWWRIVEEA